MSTTPARVGEVEREAYRGGSHPFAEPCRTRTCHGVDGRRTVAGPASAQR